MPIYEYECVKCGERFEQLRQVKDHNNEVKCPKCGAEHLRRVFSAFVMSSANQSCAPSKPT